MPIGKALLLKGLGGLTALGGAIGGGYSIYDYYINQETKFDRGLIDYLEAGGKIQFSVKNGNESSSTEITNDFPQFTTSGTTPTATVTIKVSVATATGNDGGTLTDATTTPDPEKGQKANLKKLNGTGDGTDWTWECKIVFEKSGTATELKDKEKLVKDSEEKGFFNKLKDTDTNNKHKELKIKFIKDCAAKRGKDKNKDINKKESLDSNKIESTKTFKLIDNSETTKKLIPEDQSDFNYWFGITSN